jgi:hypothetical protein
MITDSKKLQHIRDSWNTVRILEARIKRTLNAGLFALVPMMTNFKQVPESLLLLLLSLSLKIPWNNFATKDSLLAKDADSSV